MWKPINELEERLFLIEIEAQAIFLNCVLNPFTRWHELYDDERERLRKRARQALLIMKGYET
jgi:hypothetical protein